MFARIFIVSLLSMNAFADEKYLCIPEKSTGFSYSKDKSDWRVSTFDTSEKYIVHKVEGSETNEWKVKSFDSSHIASCDKDFNQVGKLYCTGINTFRMNKYNGRFMLVHAIGYWDDGINEIYEKTPAEKTNPFYDKPREEGSNTPYIAIGKCTTI